MCAEVWWCVLLHVLPMPRSPRVRVQGLVFRIWALRLGFRFRVLDLGFMVASEMRGVRAQSSAPGH